MKQAKDIIESILSSGKIVITSHRSPDGDSIGSSMALYYFIKNLGKKAVICHPDPCPYFLEWVKDDVKIYDFENNKEEVESFFQEADLIFSLDYNEPYRLGKEMGNLLINSSAKKIMIDHHLNPYDFVDIKVSLPDVCSTSQLIYELVVASGKHDLLDEKVGTPIYLGIMTDTGSFRFPSLTSRTHHIIADLIDRGVEHYRIHEQTFDNNRLDKVKLNAYLMLEKLEILDDLHVAIVFVTEEELQRFNYQKGDLEGVVNNALALEGIQMAVFLREDKDRIKLSFRSKGNLAVNVIAMNEFSGGGHKNAAGGIYEESMEKALKHLKNILPKYIDA